MMSHDGTMKIGKARTSTFVTLVVLILASTLCFGCGQQTKSTQGASESQEASDVTEQLPLDAISWEEASRHIGETVTIYGTVANIERDDLDEDHPTYFDIGVPYPDPKRFTMIIYGADRDAFPDSYEDQCRDKTICVTGEIFTYENVCYIAASSPSQVQILE